MKVNTLLGGLAAIAFLAVTTQSCKKENGIDNNNVVERPYVLFAADNKGTIYSTNDGKNYTTVFAGDGIGIRTLATSGPNLMIVKDETLFLSKNDGQNFNPTYKTVVAVPVGIKWPYFILDVPDDNRVYLADKNVAGYTVISDWHGEQWYKDSVFKADTPITIESYTRTSGKVLYAYSLTGSKLGTSHLFSKTGKDGDWLPVKTTIASGYNYYLSHNGNTVILTDYDGNNGAWYSNDNGATFTKYTGLPSVTLYATCAPFDEVLMVGAADGLYRYNGTTFVKSTAGIDNNTIVYGIAAKSNLYKNDALKKYVYLATSTGIYVSEDLGVSWVKQKTGDYRIIY